MTDSTRPTSNSGPSAVERSSGDAATAQLAITSSADQQAPPNILDAEGKINSGQVRSGLERNQARHSAFRPYER
jgi:hypothetical protein